MKHMTLWRRLAGFLPAALAFLSTSALAQTALYSVKQLELPPGYTAAYVVGINNAGNVVGVMITQSDYETCEVTCVPTVWVDGKATLLGLLPGATGANPSGINNANQIVGSSSGRTAGTDAVIWNNGTPTLLPSPSSQYGQIFATAVNDLGQVVGYGEQVNTGYEVALTWSGLTPIELGQGGNVYGQASGINSNGLIVGNVHNVPVVWHGTQPTRLPLNEPYYGGIALAVNDSGVVVGSTRAGELYSSHAAAWINGGMTTLGPTVGQSSATAINNRGIIVGKSFSTTTYDGPHAVLWGSIASPMQDLNRLISAADSSTLTLQSAYSINDSCTIVANGFSRATPQHLPAGFVLTLNDPSLCTKGL